MKISFTKQTAATVAAIIIVATVAAAYFIFNPGDVGWFPRCPWLMLTGWKCPGCGSQRALHALLHLDIAGAWRYNAAFVLAIPLILLLLVANKIKWLKSRLYSPIAITSILILFILWTIARNLLNL